MLQKTPDHLLNKNTQHNIQKLCEIEGKFFNQQNKITTYQQRLKKADKNIQEKQQLLLKEQQKSQQLQTQIDALNLDPIRQSVAQLEQENKNLRNSLEISVKQTYQWYTAAKNTLAHQKIKKLCKQQNKQMIIVRNLGLSSFIRALKQM